MPARLHIGRLTSFSIKIIIAAAVILLMTAATSLADIAIGERPLGLLPTNCDDLRADAFTVTAGEKIYWHALVLEEGGPGEFTIGDKKTTSTFTLKSGLKTSGAEVSGTAAIPTAGTYFISVCRASMSRGNYFILFNLHPAVVSPPLVNFGTVFVDTAGVLTKKVSVTFTGDEALPVELQPPISPPDGAEPFTVTRDTTAEQPLSSSFPVTVTFDPSKVRGPFPRSIPKVFILSATAFDDVAAVTPAVLTVTVTVQQHPAEISCASPSCDTSRPALTIDGNAGDEKDFEVAVANSGTAAVKLTSVRVVDDPVAPAVSPEKAFTLVSAPETIAAKVTDVVKIHFKPPAIDASYCGHLEIETDPPADPPATKQCFFSARSYHPPRPEIKKGLVPREPTPPAFPAATFVRYVVTVHNFGGTLKETDESDEISDDLDKRFLTIKSVSAFGSGTGMPRADVAGNRAIWNGTIPTGAEVRLVIDAELHAPPGTHIENTAQVRFDGSGAGHANSASSASFSFVVSPIQTPAPNGIPALSGAILSVFLLTLAAIGIRFLRR